MTNLYQHRLPMLLSLSTTKHYSANYLNSSAMTNQCCHSLYKVMQAPDK